MKRVLFMFFIMIVIMGTFIGCTNSQGEEGVEDSSALLQGEWEDILEEGKGQKVNIHMWGGDPTVNRYMDEWVAPRLKEAYNITLNRVPITDPKDMINKLFTEKEVDKEQGTIDLMWINGENFKFAKDNQLLWGPFTEKLPNFNTYVDKEARDITYDFGENTQGLESPWGRAQFVFIYDSEKIENPPKSMEELKAWAEENPGKFTYPAPPDFTGSAFIRHVLYYTTGGYEKYMAAMDEETFTEEAKPLWDYLNSIAPYLWRQGQTYPESSTKLDQLYGNGEIWMTMSYTPSHGQNKIKAGEFPTSTRTFVLEQGTLANTHYLSIPFNATHKAGAMVVANFLLSPEAQIEKLKPESWGDGLVIDPEKLSPEEREILESLDMGEATLSAAELQSHGVPEIPSTYVDILERGWKENVAK